MHMHMLIFFYTYVWTLCIKTGDGKKAHQNNNVSYLLAVGLWETVFFSLCFSIYQVVYNYMNYSLKKKVYLLKVKK